jgi:hypothetical protein
VSPPKREWFEVARRAGSALKHRHAYAVQIVFNSLPDTVKVFFCIARSSSTLLARPAFRPASRKLFALRRYNSICQKHRAYRSSNLAVSLTYLRIWVRSWRTRNTFVKRDGRCSCINEARRRHNNRIENRQEDSCWTGGVDWCDNRNCAIIHLSGDSRYFHSCGVRQT